MDFSTQKSNGIAEIIMNNPPVNAFGPEQLEALAREVTSAGDDEAMRVVILRAEGRGFCAGIDIKSLTASPDSITAVNRSAFNAFEAVHKCKVPVVAAVHGFALGAGAAIVGACDVVFAAEGTQFGLPEIKVGMLGGASHMLRLLPLAKVRAMYFTGEPIDAGEMYRLGAVEAVTSPDNLKGTAYEFAEKIAARSSPGLRLAKEALNGIEPVDLERNYRYEQGFTFEISHMAVAQETRNTFTSNN